MRKSCSCDMCKSACQHKPGWLVPGDAEKIARYLNVTVEQLFDAYLAIDYYFTDDGEPIFVLSPAVRGMDRKLFPAIPTGVCVFFEDGRCSIHEVAPFECQEYHHTDIRDVTTERHKQVALAWIDNQFELHQLYGEPIQLSPVTFDDYMSLLLTFVGKEKNRE